MTREENFRVEVHNAVGYLATITHALSGLDLAYSRRKPAE